MCFEARPQPPLHDVVIHKVGQAGHRGCACLTSISLGQGFEK
jgi:hypothetical protein